MLGEARAIRVLAAGRPRLHHRSSLSDSKGDPTDTLKFDRNSTAKMSDDEERVTMPFKFVTGESSTSPEAKQSLALTLP